MKTPIAPSTFSLVAIVVTVAIALTSVVLVQLIRPHEDNAVLNTAILGFSATILASLLGAQRNHVVMNSRMDEFKRELEAGKYRALEAAHREGVSAGKVQGAAEADKRTDDLAAQKGQS